MSDVLTIFKYGRKVHESLVAFCSIAFPSSPHGTVVNRNELDTVLPNQGWHQDKYYRLWVGRHVGLGACHGDTLLPT